MTAAELEAITVDDLIRMPREAVAIILDARHKIAYARQEKARAEAECADLDGRIVAAGAEAAAGIEEILAAAGYVKIGGGS